ISLINSLLAVSISYPSEQLLKWILALTAVVAVAGQRDRDEDRLPEGPEGAGTPEEEFETGTPEENTEGRTGTSEGSADGAAEEKEDAPSTRFGLHGAGFQPGGFGVHQPGFGVQTGFAGQPGFGGQPVIGGQNFGGQGGPVGSPGFLARPPVSLPSNNCRLWCKGKYPGQFYCCEDSSKPVTIPVNKPGACPPTRPVCPRFFTPPLVAPQTCGDDSKCPGYDKCCFDICLEEHVCKPAVV
ncbi:uncharacterized protein LOC122244036, partial [Penaeus japonicus]|uniref:uncharacterized protein LOC122244036 n=1 Tax=Penaeus japonicus TaxID=27405 RepID=UPI001C70B19E